MKLSEVIAKLQLAQAQHGEMDVYGWNHEFATQCDLEDPAPGVNDCECIMVLNSPSGPYVVIGITEMR